MSGKKQEKKEIQKQRTKTEDVESVENPNVDTQIDSDALEDLLNEIDNVLEVNAEQFVNDYIQKGGE